MSGNELGCPAMQKFHSSSQKFQLMQTKSSTQVRLIYPAIESFPR